MSPSSLGTFSTLAVKHQGKNEDFIPLEVRSTQVAHESGPSGDSKTESLHEMGRLPNIYLSERPRRPSALSLRDSNGPQLGAPTDNAINLGSGGSVDGSGHPAAALVPPSTTTARQKRSSRIQFLAICWSIYVVGWHDGSNGPLLPRIQQEYKLSFTAVSMVFVGSCFGYICGAAMNIWFNDKMGFGKTIVLGAVCQLVAYVFIIPALPFPVLVCANVVAGFGLSLQAAQCNGYVGSLLDNMTVKMGVMHGSYGLGAFTAPFASTYFSRFARPKWPLHYVISASLSFLNVALLIWVFRFRRQEDVLLEIGQEHVPETAAQAGNKYRQIVRMRAVHFMTIFAVIYIGVEVTLGGWIVTFIIRERHGGSSSGYISSGFWGGLTLGRVGLIWLNKIVGEYPIIFVYALIAIALELTIWFVPSIIENAIAISVVGLVLGPMFPLLVQHMTRVLPRWLLTGSVGLVAGIGVAGSAALPFMTGLLAERYGIYALQPLMIVMLVILTLVWAFVPREGRRAD